MKDDLRDLFLKRHGVISRYEAIRAGLTPRQIRTRIQTGDWQRVYPSVYRTTAMPPTAEQHIRAAVLATRAPSVASYQSAAWLWGLVDRPPLRPAVTAAPGVQSRSRGFDLHRSGDLDWGRVLVHRGIECTDPLRTLVDFAAVAEGATLDRSIDIALAQGMVTVAGMEQEMCRLSRQGRRGVAPLRMRLELRGFVGAPNPSVLESLTLRLLVGARIEVIGTEVVVGPDGEYRLDIALTDGVTVEVDGYRWHSTPEQKTRDERRRNRIRLEGVLLLVFTWNDVVRNGARMVIEIRQALAAQSDPARSRRRTVP